MQGVDVALVCEEYLAVTADMARFVVGFLGLSVLRLESVPHSSAPHSDDREIEPPDPSMNPF